MNIKELREKNQISQKTLAEAVNTSQRNIGRWENGENEPSYVQLIKLADFFNCSLDYLVGREKGDEKMTKEQKTAFEMLYKYSKNPSAYLIENCNSPEENAMIVKTLEGIFNIDHSGNIVGFNTDTVDKFFWLSKCPVSKES